MSSSAFKPWLALLVSMHSAGLPSIGFAKALQAAPWTNNHGSHSKEPNQNHRKLTIMAVTSKNQIKITDYEQLWQYKILNVNVRFRTLNLTSLANPGMSHFMIWFWFCMISKKVHILQNGGVVHLLLDISPHPNENRPKSGSFDGHWRKAVFGVWEPWLEWELQQRSTLYGGGRGGRFDWQVKTMKTDEKLWKTMKNNEKLWKNYEKQWKTKKNNEK